jgi:hypothetical protein
MTPIQNDRGTDPCSAVRLPLLLTGLLMLLHPGDVWWHAALFKAYALLGLLFPRVAAFAPYWIGAAVWHLAVQNVHNFSFADNHTWLFSYWYLAVGTSLLSKPNSHVILAANARFLILFTFLFATVTKLESRDFVNGHTMYHILLLDSRVAPLVADITGESVDRPGVERQFGSLATTVALPGNQSLLTFAKLLSWAIVGGEAIIALLFALPNSGRLLLLRSVSIIAFTLAVYPVFPVLGFASILLVMSVAHLQGALPAVRCVLLILFVTVRVAYYQFAVALF